MTRDIRMTRYEALGRCLDLVLEMKRFHSRGGRSQEPDTGVEAEFDMYDCIVEIIRDIMKEVRG